MNKEICLLLTATIEVENKNIVKRNDTKTRLEDYKIALKKWLTCQKSISKIVFVENSGYPLDELREIAKNNNPQNKNVEFISLKYSTAKDKDSSMGEIRSIEYALNNSKILEESREFVKVTGRIFVKNIDAIIRELPNRFAVVSKLSENLMYLDSTICIFNKLVYLEYINPYVVEQMQRETGQIDFESVYARAVHYLLEKNYPWYPFSHEPILSGMSGAKNISYAGRYGRRRSLAVDFFSRFYHRFFRNVYSSKQKREHFLVRWNIKPRGKDI